MSEAEFAEWLKQARQHDKDALLRLIHYFEPDIQYMCRFMLMPKEDAEQSLRLELIDLLKHAEV
ncbi:hypothetical protein NDS46_25115 [Paenibacillus thiaminolyticus]|uniref:hypothetical protein n=1 Tax=Paenibacillus thiaminolyticus TaxID=49283 RepID=UPI00232DFF2F|nr:hypothetical protein [Paenibacillus thiaminolyticus]WCF07551.1 hypothetical protein NDS46_25115 [Paenibacillus thiaminolyticus]